MKTAHELFDGSEAHLLDEDQPSAASAGLVWSTEVPTIPGWYWYKDHHGVVRIEQVHQHLQDSDTLTILENSWMGWRHVSIKNMGRQWAGPIIPPIN